MNPRTNKNTIHKTRALDTPFLSLFFSLINKENKEIEWISAKIQSARKSGLVARRWKRTAKQTAQISACYVETHPKCAGFLLRPPFPHCSGAAKMMAERYFMRGAGSFDNPVRLRV
jgi:hypothetical protein